MTFKSKYPFIEFNGLKFYRRPDDGYYYRKYPRTIYLHRYVWEFHNSKIPSNYHIHHIDENKDNNDISNLELISDSEHSKHHAITNEWITSGKSTKVLKDVSHLAKEWHGSKEGLAWHSEHGKKTWENRTIYCKMCEYCNNEYGTYYKNKSKYCSDKCKNLHRYKKVVSLKSLPREAITKYDVWSR